MSATTSAAGIESPVVVSPSPPSPATRASVHLLDYDITIPPIHSVAEFQEWAESDSFPPRGRIDYIAGSIEVDMSPEDLYSHGTLTSEIHLAVGARVKQTRRGQTL